MNAPAVKCQRPRVDIDARAIETALIQRPLEVANQSRSEAAVRAIVPPSAAGEADRADLARRKRHPAKRQRAPVVDDLMRTVSSPKYS